MKAILEFDFDKEDSDDKSEHARMLKATDLCGCLWDFDQYLRDTLKYGEKMPTVEEIRDKLHEEMNTHGIVLEDLYS